MPDSSDSLKVLVILGSVREGRMAERVGHFVANKLKDAHFNVEILDPQELGIPLINLHKTPQQFYVNLNKVPKIVLEVNEKIKSADCYVIISAEYNRQLPPALTNFIDYMPPRSYTFKASAIVTYSLGSGGASAAAQARTLMVEMGAMPVPYLFQITEVAKKLDENGCALIVEEGDNYLQVQAQKMITQLSWYATAFKNHRKLVGEPQWADTVSK